MPISSDTWRIRIWSFIVHVNLFSFLSSHQLLLLDAFGWEVWDRIVVPSQAYVLYDKKICWVMKSTSSAMSSSLTLRRISSAEWHEQSPGKTSCMGMCQLETSTDQILITQRKRTRSHEIATISPCPEPLGRTWHLTFTHDSVVGDPWGSIITRKWEAWRILRKRGMTAIRSQETDEDEEKKIESKWKTLPNYCLKFLYPNPWYILYWQYYN